MFEITGDDISLLNDEDLRALIGRLRVSRDREHGFHRIVSKYFAGS